MAFRVPSPNVLPQSARNAVQAVKEYADSLGKPTDWTYATYQNGWVAYNGFLWHGAQYRKVGDMVQIRGMVSSGTVNTAIFTLPEGFRPALWHEYATVSNALFGWLRVTGSGDVVLVSGSNAWVSLDCQFSIAP